MYGNCITRLVIDRAFRCVTDMLVTKAALYTGFYELSDTNAYNDRVYFISMFHFP